MNTVFTQGYEAYSNGVGRSENPHPNNEGLESDWAWWDEGWQTAFYGEDRDYYGLDSEDDFIP